MKQTFTFLLIGLMFCSCTQNKKLTYSDFNFKIEGFAWEPSPYKFSSSITDSVLPLQGQQYASWEFAYIGDIKNMLETWDIDAKLPDTLNQTEVNNFASFERKSAIPYIIEKAKNKKIVIINEAHQMPQHRVFTTQLLQNLYDLGFRHLGMESYMTSYLSDSALLFNKYPILKNGYYVKEPQYGNLMREALKIGYSFTSPETQAKIIPYFHKGTVLAFLSSLLFSFLL